MASDDGSSAYVQPDSKFRYLIYLGLALAPVIPFLPPQHQFLFFGAIAILLAGSILGDIYILRQQGVEWRSRHYLEAALVLIFPLIAYIYPWERRDQILRSRRDGALTGAKSEDEK